MSVTENIGALGGWSVQLAEETPQHVLDDLGWFGHVAVIDGPVDVDAVGDGLLTAARYVGVLREKGEDDRLLAGESNIYWLGDEDGKGDALETEVVFDDDTLTTCVTALLPQSLTVGTIHATAGTYTGRHQYQSRRAALDIVCDAFGVEYRVNGDWSVDVGTAAQLYNTETPDTIIRRRGPGADIDLVSLGGQFEVGSHVRDYTRRVVLLGQTIGTGDEPGEVFATGSAEAATPYLDPQGNPLKSTRFISESGQTVGSVAARAQLQLNRFNRVVRSLRVTADELEAEGNFSVGDNVWVYDPETGIVNAANEVTFQGEVLHPDLVRVTGATWHLVEGMTVAFRTMAGVWLDLTPFVTWETGTNELTVGDLPKTLTRSTDDPIQVRLDASRGDSSIPAAPTGLTLSTDAFLDPQGRDRAVVIANWTAPTLNTDGSTITDLSHYVVQFGPTFRAPLYDVRFTEATTIELPAVIDLDYDVRVAAVDTANHVGAFTAVQTILSAADATAPPPPAAPVVTSYLGQLRIEYDGTDNLGSPMPSDANRVDVHVGTTAGFTHTTATRVDSITPFAKGVSYATAPYGSARWVKLVAVDHAGNESGPSTTVTGSTTQVADGDVASLSVGKLTAGIMTADVTVSGRFTTALTGARVEMNATGFQKYDASSNLLVSITGTDALLTGTYKTALTGRRIEIGSAGVLGEVNFYAPDGTRSMFRAYTESGGVEAVQFGIPLAGTNTLWNRINYNNDGDGWANYRADKHEFQFGANLQIRYTTDRGVTSAGRMQITADATTFYTGSPAVGRVEIASEIALWDLAGHERLRIQNDNVTRFNFDGWASTGMLDLIPGREPGSYFSPALKFFTPLTSGNQFWAAQFVYGITSAGTFGGFECLDGDAIGYVAIKASSFVVSSSETGKEDIEPWAGRPRDLLSTLTPVTFRRRHSGGGRELGFIAETVPAEFRVEGSRPDDPGISTMPLLAAVVAEVAELRRDVETLRGRAA